MPAIVSGTPDAAPCCICNNSRASHTEKAIDDFQTGAIASTPAAASQSIRDRHLTAATGRMFGGSVHGEDDARARGRRGQPGAGGDGAAAEPPRVLRAR